MSSCGIKNKQGKSPRSLSPISKYNYKTVEEWLDSIGLTIYIPAFKKYKNVEDLLKLSESSLKRLGIKNAAHRARMMSSIAVLRDADKKSKNGSFTRLERLKQEANIPRSIFKLMFHSNKALVGPIGIVPSLSLPSIRDLEGVLWYHGMISRVEAESLIMKEGDFLVRDSSSHAGEVVLTCYKDSSPVHFVINCIECQRSGHGVNEKFYKFDDDAFPSITSLIKHHMESGRPVTSTSGAVLINPIPSLKKNVITGKAHEKLVFDHGMTDKWTGSQPLLSLQDASPLKGSCSLANSLERFGSMPSMFKNSKDTPLANETSSTLSSIERLNHDSVHTKKSNLSGEHNSFSAVGCEASNDHSERLSKDLQQSPTAICTSQSKKEARPKVQPPPPKPSRVPTLRFNEAGYRPMVTVRNDALYNDGSEDEDDEQDVKKSEVESFVPPGDDFDLHTSPFIKPGNKPLDPNAMMNIKSFIMNQSAAIVARHITYVDINILKIIPASDHELNLVSGLEMITLPQGHCLRISAIEKHHCLRMFVSAVTLNGHNVKERCDLIAHWLSIAMELKVNAGNTFSFYSIMDALCSSQIVRLKQSWRFLKVHHGKVFEIFETKLLPNYRSLLDASSLTLPHQKGSITPHIFPLLELLERPFTQLLDDGVWKLGSWEMNQPFFGLDVILIHLETARLITSRIHLYREATERFLASNGPQTLDPSLLNLLDMKTQAKFLWGSKGARAERTERLAKFDHLLSLLSEVVEKELDDDLDHNQKQ